ncbi:hypothetical protein [Parasphingorhabdus cellanae]|uniref:Lipoprotein n=1 Tax=Parasphingorhabdus cellanae TaxID=2806553 RepID=A0ABX7T572_9SPHN|nr:hypothetical protein [Parasphingorhabdus cellanae]QTD56738.1 hypothetical protein J4G78_03935 [Parasphingorhabdus cellanae]
MNKRIKIPTFGAALLALSACASSVSPAGEPAWSTMAPPEQREHIVITGFECGDNCYLNYRPKDRPTGERKTALCSTGICADWYTEQEMPAAYIGRGATVTLGIGQQVDGGGNVMSDDFPEIKGIVLDPEAP